MDREEFIQNFRIQQGLSRQPSENKFMHATIGLEGRWEYLHQLEKLKRSKLEEQRNRKERELYEKELSECTFTPKLNKVKNYRILNTKLAGNNQIDNYSLINKVDSNLLERQQSWSSKKNMKIEKIKQYQYEKNNEECFFKPKLVFN
jgi:hypothetical protein